MNDDNFSFQEFSGDGPTNSAAADELRQLDRLVDRQLSDADRKELLLSLDARPEGWRRCALAFLEAQTWGDEFRALARESATPAKAEHQAPAELSRAKPNRAIRWTTLWAMAASFLLAFIGVTNWSNLARVAGLRSGESDDQTATTVATAQPVLKSAAPPAAASDGPETIVMAVPDENGTMRAVRVPLVEVGSSDDTADATGAGDQELLPPELVDAFRRSGREIEQHRQLLPVDLQDGRRAYVPVDQLRIRNVDNKTFQ